MCTGCAFSIRLSSTCARSSRSARHPRRSAERRAESRCPASDAGPAHRSTARPAISREIQARSLAVWHARGSCEVQQVVDETGQPVDLDRCLARPRPPCLRRPARSPPSRSRSPVSGVRSWCEAFATKSRWAATFAPSVPAIWLNDRASDATSLGPGGIRPGAEVSPPQANGGLLEPAHRARERGREEPGERQGRRRRPPDRSARAPSQLRCTRDRIAASGSEIRTAPIDCPLWTTGTVTSRRSWPSVSLNRCSVVIRPPRTQRRTRGARLVTYSVPGGRLVGRVGHQPAQAGRPPRPWP